MGALSHDVIHGLDITEPLGLASAPAERIRLVLEQAGEKNLAYFGTDLTGVRLIAEDAEFSMGTGPREVRASAREMLLTVTGRRAIAGPEPSTALTGGETGCGRLETDIVLPFS